MSKYTYVVQQFNGAPVRTFSSLAAARTWARSHAVLAGIPRWDAHAEAMVWLGYYSRADAIRCWAFPPPSLRLRIERHKRA